LSIFGLHSIRMKPNGLNNSLQAFLYKTLRLSRFLYGIENTTLNEFSMKKLNTMQNSLFRYLCRLNKFAELSGVQVRSTAVLYFFSTLYWVVLVLQYPVLFLYFVLDLYFCQKKVQKICFIKIKTKKIYFFKFFIWNVEKKLEI
jgi:hypothetical protein